VIFTSGGTEANNFALNNLPSKGRLAISAIEHPSISDFAAHLACKGVDLHHIEVDSAGVIPKSSIENFLNLQPDLVSIMLANNETGVIQDVKLITEAIKAKNKSILVHTDAVQAVGKIPVSFKELGVDLLTLSSHKIYGPKGCGAIVYNTAHSLKPLLFGGNQEKYLRPGTENVSAMVGFGKAAELAAIELTHRHAHLAQLKQKFEAALTQIPNLYIFSQTTERLPNTIQFGIDGVDGEMLLMNLDRGGIAVSSGSACKSGSNEISPVLKAMKIAPNLAKSAIRVSLGMSNTEDQITQFIKQLKKHVNH
jgi:cysteine desulfurase